MLFLVSSRWLFISLYRLTDFTGDVDRAVQPAECLCNSCVIKHRKLHKIQEYSSTKAGDVHQYFIYKSYYWE